MTEYQKLMNNIQYLNSSQMTRKRNHLVAHFRQNLMVLMLVLLTQISYGQVAVDLALRIFPTESNPVVPGDIASFTIEVHNQGTIAAKNVKLVDYIPEGLEFVTTGNAGWSSIGDKAITTIQDVIQPGSYEAVEINLKVKGSATPKNISNYAEIALTQDINGVDTSNDDIDSTPDTDNTNDKGAQAFSSNDDYLQGNGILDEDDHDVALLIICTQNVCNDDVNISLNAACDIEILADMIVENPAYPNGAYTVILVDENGNTLPSNMVNGSHVGQTFQVTAFIEGCEPNSCWGFATIEDKLAIELTCSVDTVDCGMSEPLSVGLPIPQNATYIQIGDLFIVDGVNGCSDIELSYEDEQEMLPCQTGSPYVVKINRLWTAIDGVGNEVSCTSEIYVRKGYLSDITPPPNYDNLDIPALMCGEYPQLSNGNPDPSFTGFPEGLACPNIIAVYEDTELDVNPSCTGSFDVLREWTIIDWCTGDDTTFTQLIKIMDIVAPTCNAPLPFSGSSYADLCIGSVDVVPPFLSDNCSSVTYDIAYKPYVDFDDNFDNLLTDNIINSNGDFSIEHLDVGRYRIAYFAEDACGNTSQCLGEFSVEDTQDPTPVCIVSTSVTLDAFGSATLEADFFDAGSFDNCEIDKIQVARMTDDCNDGGDQFKTSVNFCCADAGQEVMIRFRVSDKAGNSNLCMVGVTVIDDIAPTIICPADMTFSCTEYEEFYGQIPDSIAGQAIAFGNCDPELTYYDTQVFNNCGVGIIVRLWSAVDPAGNETTCKQYFEIESDFQFDVNMIEWPSDTLVNQCLNDFIDPDITGVPLLPTTSCSDFDIDYIDHIKLNNGAGCGIVERTFTITDLCAIDPFNNTFSYVQEIEVFEFEDPEFFCEDITVSADDDTCEGFVDYTAIASDNCTAEEDIKYSFTVDYFDDGTIDESNQGNNLNGVYPTGIHKAVFRAEDECGNDETCTVFFTVQDEKQPTPLCLPISVSLDENGEVEIWASDFNLNSFDNCTSAEDLVYSFSPDIDDQIRIFDCDDLENGMNAVISIQMHVWDEGGNYDFCTVILTITDTQDFCPDVGTFSADISGEVMTTKNLNAFPEVEMLIEGNSMEMKNTMSDESGEYTFTDLSLYDNYTIKPYKNDDALNGITTLDIVRIQKHILGLNTFTEKEEIIAADVNHSESISGVDIIQLRKLILGVYADEKLPQNDSWRFMPTDFEWNPVFPYEFPEEMVVDNLLESYDDASFYGIKIGDVNSSASVNAQSSVQTRSTPRRIFMDEGRFEQGDCISVPVYADFSQNLEGLQLGIRFDEDIIAIKSISSPILDIRADHYNIMDDEVYMSWDKIGGLEVQKGEVIFVIEIDAQTAGSLSTAGFELIEDFNSELFDSQLEVGSIELSLRNDDPVIKATQLLQNEPNPFAEMTQVSFDMEHSDLVYIYLYDAQGKMLVQEVQKYEKGTHVIQFTGDQFRSTGLFYLTMESSSWSSTIKLVRIQ